jgi:hypothetical protein
MTDYVLPAVRAHIARELIEKHGFSQVSAGGRLGLTQSAMSRYLASDRGSRIRLSPEVAHSIASIADDLAHRGSQLTLTVEETCRICLSMRRSGDFCRLHRALDRGVPESCDACIRMLGSGSLHL